MSMAQSRARAAYGRGAETLPPGRQIVLLYDAAIARIDEAGRAVREHRIEDRWRAVAKARRIVEALQACLDFEHGGTIAPMLDRIYGYLLRRMIDIDVTNDEAGCKEVADRLRELREAWAEIENTRVGPAPTPEAAGSATMLTT